MTTIIKNNLKFKNKNFKQEFPLKKLKFKEMKRNNKLQFSFLPLRKKL